MKHKLGLLIYLLLFVFTFNNVSAQQVDTVAVFSNKMNKYIKNLIILPEGYNSNTEYPVVYLLHGYGGNYKIWLAIKKDLPQQASNRGFIIVCPDGQNSWYWDSPIDRSSMYETYISEELVKYIDSNYSTISLPKGRAISGFSMGGHGSLWITIRHPYIFGACGSMSGGVDIRPFPNNWDMKKMIGPYKNNRKVWDEHTVINQIDKIKPNTLSIIIDCGKDDFFYQVNEELHKKMNEKGIKHDYSIRPGAHTFTYWRNSIDYHLDFFSQFFLTNKNIAFSK